VLTFKKNKQNKERKIAYIYTSNNGYKVTKRNKRKVIHTGNF